MRAEIISVGNQTRYHNLFEAAREYLQRELPALNITLGSARVVPPRTAEVFAQLLEASRQGDLILVLTAPDPAAAQAVTDAICEGLRLQPRTDTNLARQLARRAAQQGRELTRAEAEAFSAAPSGCRRIINPTGLVQGYAISAKKQLMLALPAAPSELTACFSSTVRQLLSGVGGSTSAQRTLWAVELGESPIRSMLGSLLYSQNPRLALQNQGGECEIHITATGQNAQGLCDQMADTLTERLGTLITSTQGEPLSQQVGRLLHKHDLTVSAAEAGTGGHLAAMIKGGAPHDKVLAGGMTLTSNQDKAERLGVSKELLAEAGGVSRRVTAAMAAAVRKKGRSKVGVAVTCGLDPQSPKAGVIYAAVTDGIDVWAKKLTLPPDSPPEAVSAAACLQAMNMLRLYLQRYPKAMPGGTPLAQAVPGSVTLGDRLMAAVSGLVPKGKAAPSKGGEHKNHQSEKESKEMNLLQKIRYGKLTKNDSIRLGILGLSLVVFVGCIVYISSVYAESHKNKGLIQDQQSAYSNSNIRPEDVDGYPSGYLDKFAALYAQNDDIAGWIKIDGTKYLDMPVVQTIDNDYYERRDFTRAHNDHGVAFVDYRVAQREPSTNTVIYAHNMNDGQMFGELLNYKSIDYYRQHPLVSYDSVYYEGMYKIFGVVVCKKDDPDFLYHNFIDKGDDAEMTEFVNKIRERSILNTKVDVRTDDHLLTMSTCDYTFKSETGERIARFVLFARKVREGESTDVDTAGATINTNPVMPAEWYAQLKRNQEAELKRQQEQAAQQANAKWLTEQEMKELSAEDQKALAQRREDLAQQYLTYDEREDNSLSDILDLIDYRRSQFELYLTDEEQGYSLTKRLSLSEERRAQARAAGLTDEEIRKAGDWESIQKIINSKGDAALDAVIKLYPSLLTSEDKTVAKTAAELEQLAASRKQEAELLGLRVADYASWSELQTAINNAKGANAAQKELDDFIAKNSQYLTPADKEGRDLEGLKKLLEERKQAAANAAEEKKKKEEFLANAENTKWISGSTENLTYAELVAQRDKNRDDFTAVKNKAASDPKYKAVYDALLAAESSGSWSEKQSAINKANNDIKAIDDTPVTPPPVTPENPGGTTTPENPGGTTTPENPGGTTTPENPGGTTTPENPGGTTTPENPDQPAGPVTPEPEEPKPDNPEPDNPEPDNPTPDNPEPDNPEPDNPPAPENPADTPTDTTPVQGEQPTADQGAEQPGEG